MDRLTYLKGERSKARKHLKKYLVIFRDELQEECGLSFPTKEEIKKFTSEEFDNWFLEIVSIIQEQETEDLILTELIENYICAFNNVTSAEIVSTTDFYY